MADHADEILDDFQGVVGLFPLPGVVFFPHVVLPLHIFEGRYRQLLQHALETERLIGMVQSRPVPGESRSESPLEPVGCLGQIYRSERLADGRYNLLLLGLRRFRIVQELPVKTLYRQAQIELLEDQDDPSTEASRSRLIGDFLRAHTRAGEIDPEFEQLLRSDLPMGTLADIITYALGLPPAVAQTLLAEPRVPLRIDLLRTILQQPADSPAEASRPRSDPPPFSTN